MPVDPANYVIKVYTTAALAEVGADNTAFDVDALATGKIAGYQDEQYFKQFEKYYYRIEFNEPAIAVEIDWDDGEDNSPEKANRQYKRFDTPRMFTVLEHIYTKAGRFFPLIRATSPEGFVSKWYTTYDTNNDYSPLENETLAAGQNNHSYISPDSNTGSTLRIPYFVPTIFPPKAILKTDRKTIFSGIEDDSFYGTIGGADTVLPNEMYAWHSAESLTYPTSALNDDVQVKVKYMTTDGHILEETIDTQFSGNTFALSNPVKKILRTELVKMATSGSTTALGSGERVYLRAPKYGASTTLMGNAAGAHGTNVITETIAGSSGQLDTHIGNPGSYCITLRRGQLAEPLDASETDIDGDDGSIFANTDRILIDAEIMTVTNVSTNTLTVTRETEQSDAATHADDASVYILSRGSFSNNFLGSHLWFNNSAVTPFGTAPKVVTTGFSTASRNRFATAYGYVNINGATADSNGGKFRFTLASGNHPFRVGSVIFISANASAVDGAAVVIAVGGANNFTINKAWSNNNIDGTDNTVSVAASFAALADGFGLENVMGVATAASPSRLGTWFVPDFDEDTSIVNVSQGWPIQEFQDSSFRLQYDASESRTRSPNLTIPESNSNLFLDACKGYAQTSTDLDNATDKFSGNGVKKYIGQLRYTQCPFSTYANPWNKPRSYLDGSLDATADGQDGVATNRFYDDYKLLRLQVKDDRTGATGAGTGSGGFSQIESFTDYSQATNAAYNLFDELDYVNLIQFTSNSGTSWASKEGNNDDAGDDASDTYPLFGSFPGFTLVAGAHSSGPSNYILLAKELDKFDRIYFGMANRFGQGQDQHDAGDDRAQGGKIKLSLYYPSKDNELGQIHWKPLEFVDKTTAGIEDSSLYVSGPVIFDAPGDWEKTKSSSITWPDSITTNGNWTIDGYGILVGIAWEATVSSTFETNSPAINYIFPYDNKHSQLVKVSDPMHVSICDITVTQPLNFVRNGKYVQIDDRFGRTELRKIGASGGRIKIGGVAFGDYVTSTTNGYTTLKKMQKYQKEGTPLFYDLLRPDGTYMRFFGKATSLSEDVPTKRASNKWAIDFVVTHVLEYDSSGNITTDGLISLGGEIDDKPKYT